MAARASTAWLASVLVYPLFVVGSVALSVALLGRGVDAGLVVSTTTVGFGLLAFGLEKWLPARADWRLDGREAATDLLHALLSNPIPSFLFRALFYGAIVRVSGVVSETLGLGLWPVAWPLLAQVALALLVAEAASYAIHRGLHESRLWPLHAVHHCSPRMYFLLAVRKHPLQAFISYGGRLSLLWLLGIPTDALTVLLVLTAAHSAVQHANLDLRTGFLGWVFATPELHRIHHSAREADLHCNFGDVLCVYDALFGTRRAAAPPESVGLPDRVVPQTYASHLRLPFSMGDRGL